MYTRKPEAYTKVLPGFLSPLHSLRQGLSLDLELAGFTALQNASYTMTAQPFCGFQGSELRPLCLHSKHFIHFNHLSHLPSPQLISLYNPPF